MFIHIFINSSHANYTFFFKYCWNHTIDYKDTSAPCLTPFLRLSEKESSCCSFSLRSWPSVHDWCFYWCPTDSGVMRLLQRSLRSIMLTTPCNCLTAQLRLFPKKLSWDQVLPSCLTAHWNKNELILSKTFKKCSEKRNSSTPTPPPPHFTIV